VTNGGGDDAATIHRRGYRNFVGGAKVWEKIARLQFDFMRESGLKSGDKFVDVGCGALRGGRYFIEYLGPGDYYGIDKHIELIIYGTVRELSIPKFRQKRPHFAISDSFEFERLGSGFNFGLAQSLFTHLSPEDVNLCLNKLYPTAAEGCKFYATFFEADGAVKNPEASHSAKGFWYTRAEMEKFGADTGWQPFYIGNWGHPRGQRMMLYVKSTEHG
jgi:SAM-dependent methyltransferase